MRFEDMIYERVTYEEIEERYEALVRELRAAANEADCLAVLKKRYQLYDDMTPIDLCYVRHDMNVNDPFYAEEQRYYDEIGPKISALSMKFDRELTESPFHSYFEKIMGSLAFSVMKGNLEGFDSKTISLEQEENALTSRYSQLVANGKVNYNGTQVSRGSLGLEQQSSDREVRRNVHDAIAQSWEDQREQLEDIYDSLVKNRDQQAKILGYKDYVELSYLRMNRIGYTPEDVACFREQVKKYVVPIAGVLHENRKRRLGLDHLYSFDGRLFFLNGNPVPLGDDRFCIEMTGKMFGSISRETKEFIDFMLESGLFDVEARDGKNVGGYCTQFQAYRSPFIFANFDGTSENAYIMSHEGGHAFYFYLKRNEEIRERGSYTSEMAETHAMAMEFFAAPHMELLFGERAEDYRRMHLEQAVSRIIYQCQQDEFQQIIYEHPELTRQQRNEVWVRLEQAYYPYREYTEEEKLRIGFRWQQIPHFYYWPFYAIDYALAQVCALEYYQWMDKDPDGAWKSYLAFCNASGNMNFPEAIHAAGLANPFEEEGLQNLMTWLQMRLS